MLVKRYHLNWLFEAPDALLTCSVMLCDGVRYFAFGGHDKTLYIMSTEFEILVDIEYEAWVRCSYSIDLTGDGNDELLVGTGDGNCIVYKFDTAEKKLVELMNYEASDKMNCCVAGDLFQDGSDALIYGGDNKQIHIFKDFNSTEPLFTLYYDAWVLCCTLGYLKLPNIKTPVFGLLIGTKSGQFQFVQIKNNQPDILWQMFLHSRINDIKIGDVTNDGYNEIIACTDDKFVKIFNSEGERISYIKIHDSRPVSVLIEDIDGDNANEIVVGCANGFLRIYHNTHKESRKFSLKWRKRGDNSIKHITYLIDEETKEKHIIYGGYERALVSVRDFEWGKKPKLEIIPRIQKPEIPITKPHVKKITIVKKPDVVEKFTILKEPTTIEIHDPEELKKELKTEDKALDLEGLEDIDIAILTYLKVEVLAPAKSKFVEDIISQGFDEPDVLEHITSLKESNKIKYSQGKPRGWSLF